MNRFPDHLTPDNIEELSEHRFKRQVAYVRKYIYEHMISPGFKIPENCGINLQEIDMGDLKAGDYSIDLKIIEIVQKDLEELGWDTTLSYGGTMLFVHTKDLKPEQAVHCVSFE